MGELSRVTSHNPKDLIVKDNLDYVVGDHYTESTFSHVLLQGNSHPPDSVPAQAVGCTRHGRVTMGSVKVHTLGDPDVIEIDGFCGNFTNTGAQFIDPSAWGKYVVGHPFNSWFNVTQKGAGTVNILMLGESFSNHPPGVTLSSGSATFSSVGNIVRFSVDGHGNEGLDNRTMPEARPTGALQRASHAWDHFRELGAHDLALNYQHVLKEDTYE